LIEPRADRVLIQRIEEPSVIMLTDKPKSIKGVVLAVGPGKWHPGEWWWSKDGEPIDGVQPYGWNWFPGYREPCTVKPGDKVLFNSKWNDFSAGENKGTGADGSGPLERPLPLSADPKLHLVQEADIFAIVPHFDFKASVKEERPPFMQNIEIKGPWNS
jgi:co-chaperonin GroES (HSP10)